MPEKAERRMKRRGRAREPRRAAAPQDLSMGRFRRSHASLTIDVAWWEGAGARRGRASSGRRQSGGAG